MYETIVRDGEEPLQFEVTQRMAEPALTKHPETGEPVRRILTAPAVVLKHSSRRERNVLSGQNLARNGFTRYERTGDGSYERTAGTGGPKKIRS
ncbi:MAG: FmdB family transcriptional regulator [Myxococcota bacterium]